MTAALATVTPLATRCATCGVPVVRDEWASRRQQPVWFDPEQCSNLDDNSPLSIITNCWGDSEAPEHTVTPTTTPMSFALEHLDHNTREWLRTQPATIQGVVDLALVEDNAAIVRLLAPSLGDDFPAARDAIAEISELLAAIGDDATGELLASDWCRKWLGHSGDDATVEHAIEKRRETLAVESQLVASLIEAGRA